jgi:hypothetical protein
MSLKENLLDQKSTEMYNLSSPVNLTSPDNSNSATSVNPLNVIQISNSTASADPTNPANANQSSNSAIKNWLTRFLWICIFFTISSIVVNIYQTVMYPCYNFNGALWLSIVASHLHVISDAIANLLIIKNTRFEVCSFKELHGISFYSLMIIGTASVLFFICCTVFR